MRYVPAMLKPRPESPLSKVISSVIHSGFALPFIWTSRLNSDDTFLIIPFEELNGFFLVEPDRLSSFMTFSARTSVRSSHTYCDIWLPVVRSTRRVDLPSRGGCPQILRTVGTTGDTDGSRSLGN